MPMVLLLSLLLAAFTQSPVESFALEGAPATLRGRAQRDSLMVAASRRKVIKTGQAD